MPELSPHDIVHAPPDENVFTILGDRAREHSVPHLWTAMLGGTLDATLLWLRHPALAWIAAGCAAMAAYGAWGLLDRAAATAADSATTEEQRLTDVLRGIRDVAAILGTGAVAWALYRFMAAALGGWIH